MLVCRDISAALPYTARGRYSDTHTAHLADSTSRLYLATFVSLSCLPIQPPPPPALCPSAVTDYIIGTTNITTANKLVNGILKETPLCSAS